MAIKQITLMQRVSSGNKKFEVSGDIIVPDIKPDIVSITTTNANTYIYKEEISTGKIRVDGNIDAYIIYISDSGETRSIQTTLDFVETINDEKAEENKRLLTGVKLEFLEAKVLNERKINITASLNIDYQIMEKENLSINMDFEEIGNVQRLTEKTKLACLIGENKVRTSVKEDLKLDGDEDAGEILKVDLKIENSDVKTSYNKVLAKAEAKVQIIYLTEDGKIKKIESSIPIMSFIEITNIEEKHNCEVNYRVRNMLVKINNKEMHSINFQTEFEVYCVATQNEEILLTKDMYSMNKELDLESGKMTIFKENSIEEKSIKISEKIMLENPDKIYDVQTNPKITNSTQNGEMINYEGEVEVAVYYTAVHSNNLNIKQVKIPFIKSTTNTITTSDLTVINSRFSVTGEDVNVEFEIVVKNNSLTTSEITYISNVTVKEDAKESDYNMFVYFVKGGDTIWKIAKKFKVDMQGIIELNHLENPDKINVGDRLYIIK